MRVLRRTACLSAAVGALCAGLVRAQDEAPDWQPYFRTLARSYQITAESAPDQPLALHEPPVLRWSQPVRGGDDGALYVWLKDGAPAVVGTMFCWPHADGYRVVVNEFHSLLTEPLTALRDDAPAWTPREAGITWQAFKGAPSPAATAGLRLTQMRQLAERFRGENVDDNSGKKWALRLLRQPLFRHVAPQEPVKADNPVRDGALFALVSGTDPEVLVLIEARPTPEGHVWHWALARFSDRPLTAWLDDEQVWSVERARPSPTKPHTYFDVARIVRPPATEAEAAP